MRNIAGSFVFTTMTLVVVALMTCLRPRQKSNSTLIRRDLWFPMVDIHRPDSQLTLTDYGRPYAVQVVIISHHERPRKLMKYIYRHLKQRSSTDVRIGHIDRWGWKLYATAPTKKVIRLRQSTRLA